MSREIYGQIVTLIRAAAELGRSIGLHNILQPGLVKELIIADLLGHEPIVTKRHADARDVHNPALLYEYLSCKEGGSGQLDRMFKEPERERAASLDRIRRNAKIYLAVFYQADQTKVKVIYELDPEPVVREAERQLDRSRNAISHVSFSEVWAGQQGQVVYRDTSG